MMTTAENVPLIDRIGSDEAVDDCTRPDEEVRVAPYFRWKGALDVMLALVLLIPGLPLIGILIILVRVTSPGAGVFRQVRVGRGGKLFTMYKLRSMRCDAEARTGAIWTQPGDARITTLGRILRKLHLDELPQLFNVLRGEMSLIGPRPERPEFVAVLQKQIPGYLDRLSVLPGITGLAQINLPPDTDLESVRKKQQLDIEYIETATFLLDLRMLVSTFLRLIGLRGSFAMQAMRLQREVKVAAKGPMRSGKALTPDQLGKSHLKCKVVHQEITESSEPRCTSISSSVRLPR